MQLTYKVRGADGKEYGPVTLEQLTGWIREGRVLAHQEIQREDMQHWAAAGDFAELKETFGVANPPALPAGGVAPVAAAVSGKARPAALGTVRSAATWFYLVAGLSLINSIVAFTGGNWRFLFGLGVTQVFDGIGMGFASSGKIIALVLDLMAAGVLVLFGVFGGKGQTWAFLVGMVLLALDGGIQVISQDWIGAAFHAYVLFRLFQGFQACRQLNAR